MVNKAKKLLFRSGSFQRVLTGKTLTEYSIAGSSQLLRIEDRKPSDEIFSALGFSVDLVPEILQLGSVVGRLKKEHRRFGRHGPDSRHGSRRTRHAIRDSGDSLRY